MAGALPPMMAEAHPPLVPKLLDVLSSPSLPRRMFPFPPPGDLTGVPAPPNLPRRSHDASENSVRSSSFGKCWGLF